jgi:DNA-directed RNA polymerase III subunit RPC1
MFDAVEKPDEWETSTDLSLGASGEGCHLNMIYNSEIRCFAEADKALIDNISKVTEDQLRIFLDICWTKYVRAKIEPGGSFAELCFRQLTFLSRVNRRGH